MQACEISTKVFSICMCMYKHSGYLPNYDYIATLFQTCILGEKKRMAHCGYKNFDKVVEN